MTSAIKEQAHTAGQTWTKVSLADFSSREFRHEVVSYELADVGENRRFHLSFAYISPQHGHVCTGDQVIQARDMAQAAVRIASERCVDQLFVRKRHYGGQPSSTSDDINVVFDIARATGAAK